MLCVGAAYLLWLAWGVWRDKPQTEESAPAQAATFLSGLVLQFLNIKVVLYGITALSSLVLPYERSAAGIALFAAALSVIGFAGTCCWALSGAVFERFFKTHAKLVNAVMALALVYCAGTMLAEL